MNTLRKISVITLVVLSLVILLIAHLFPVSEVDAEVRVLNSEAVLNAELYLWGFDVEAGVEGGMAGGMGVRNERFFVQGPPPDLPERVGMIMNSYKDKTHKLSASTYDYVNNTENTAKIEVTTHVDRVPLWVEVIEQTVTITVGINNSVGMEKVEITKVWIEVWTDFDEEKNEYREKSVVWERETDDVLYDDNGTVEYEHPMKYDSTEKRIGIVGRVRCVMTDVNGMTDDDPRTPFQSDHHPNPNNIYGATNSQTFRIGLMVLAFPMFILAGILSLAAIVKILRDRKGAVGLLVAAGLIVGAGLLFYRWGVVTLLDMLEVAPALDLLADRYFEWTWSINLPIVSSVLLLVSGVVSWRVKKIVKDGTPHVEDDRGDGKTTEKEKKRISRL